VRYESDSSHFVPHVDDAGICVAFEGQVMAVDKGTGEVSHMASAGGLVESFGRCGDTLLVCESGGPYRLTDLSTGTARVYSSGYACQFAALGERYALVASSDAKTVRILKRQEGAGEALLAYDPSYAFSEARIDPATGGAGGADDAGRAGRALFYSYRGLRVCDLSGATVAETPFPDPMAVLDTRYDPESGNVAVLYKDALRLYAGSDGALLLDAQGKAGARSVLFSPFGVSVLSEGGEVTLHRLADGQALATAQAAPQTDTALLFPDGGLLTEEEGRLAFDGQDIGAGEAIGAGRTEGGFVFALSDGTDGHVFFVEDGALAEGFPFEAHGRSEAYFAGGHVFVSPAHGDTAAYASDGTLVRVLADEGSLADVGTLGGYVAADYVSAAGERRSLLLVPGTLETAASVPRFLGALDAGRLVLDDGEGTLRAVSLLSLKELTGLARERTGGRELTPEEKATYKAG
jgi:hypothetical protein